MVLFPRGFPSAAGGMWCVVYFMIAVLHAVKATVPTEGQAVTDLDIFDTELKVCHEGALSPLGLLPQDAEGDPSLTTLERLRDQGYITVISSYYTGCGPGRAETKRYSKVATNVALRHAGTDTKLAFLTSLKGTGSCALWAKLGATPTVIDDRDHALHYALFTTHPEYVILDRHGVLRHRVEQAQNLAPLVNALVAEASPEVPCMPTTSNLGVIGLVSGLGDTGGVASQEQVAARCVSGYTASGHVICMDGSFVAGTAKCTPSVVPDRCARDLAPDHLSISGLIIGGKAKWSRPGASQKARCASGYRASGRLVCDKNSRTFVAAQNQGASCELTCAPAFGKKGVRGGRRKSVVVGPSGGHHTSLAFNPRESNELWITDASKNSVKIIYNADTRAQKDALVRRDRAPFHYMANVSSIAFDDKGFFATCQESINDYNGAQAPNSFMGPSLYDTSANGVVLNDGSPCPEHVWRGGDPDQTCFFQHDDMLHEAPLCMGIAHDPETATPFQHVYWAFNGLDGILERFDFERVHGPCSGYLCADHAEATVRRYEDVSLSRIPAVPGHVIVDPWTRDVYIADTGNARVLRVDPDSGQVSRTAKDEFPIYSSTSPRFSYEIWTCTTQEDFVQGIPGLVPTGLAVTEALLYVADFASGDVLAFDKQTGDLVDRVKMSPPDTLTSITIVRDSMKVVGKHTLFTLERDGTVKRLAVTSKAQCPGGKAPVSRNSDWGSRIPRRSFGPSEVCVDPGNTGGALPPPQIHDPGYMNNQIPYNYGEGMTCAEVNRDAILMAGHTCHRCLPEPCLNGGTCQGVQDHGYTCTCPTGFSGDHCQNEKKQVRCQRFKKRKSCLSMAECRWARVGRRTLCLKKKQ